MNAEAVAAWGGNLFALAIAIVGWTQAVRAGRRADHATQLAVSAEARAQRAEELAGEWRDVQWEHKQDDAALAVVFTNVGTTTAYDVQVSIDRTGHERTSGSADEVPPLATVTVPGLPRRDVVMFATADASMSVEKPIPGAARLRWRSEGGLPHTLRIDRC